MPPGSDQRIANLFLRECRRIVRRGPNVEKERGVAIYDLLQENYFEPAGGFAGPYNLHLGIAGEGIEFDVRDEWEAPLTRVVMPLSRLRGIVKDYFLICDSYFKATESATPMHIEALDVGRRGVHNEGSELLQEWLADKISMDRNTARRLFTLICVLHIR
nr:conserved uncharacterized protein [uncultured bacterium]